MKQYNLGEFEELVLLVVASMNGDAYGVSILDTLVSQLSRNMHISAIHVALTRLEDKGFVTSSFGGITGERGGRRKKFYQITGVGKQVLDAQYSLRVSLYKKIPKLSFGK